MTPSCTDAPDPPLSRGSLVGTTPLVDRAVGRARSGDRHALRFLCIRYADDVYDYACRIVSGPDEAYELTRRTLADLEAAIGRYDGRDVSFPLWIRRVVRDVVERQAGR